MPVLMYHRIVPEVKGDYDRTPEDFRAELQRLFSSGYVPVRTIDFVRGDFSSVPAGKTPCVLTFDDAYVEHLVLTEDGTLDPTCAMAVIRDTAAEFGLSPAGSFNINKDPFALSNPDDVATAIKLMDSLGYEVANHTYDHSNLKKLDDAAVQRDLLLLQRMVDEAVPGATVRTLALPFGISPREKAFAASGSFEGETYTNEGILLVGSNPSKSPFSATFDPLAIPRIRSTSIPNVEMASDYWLDLLDAKPEKRYISAGNPGSVTVPAAMAELVSPAFADRLVTY